MLKNDASVQWKVTRSIKNM